MTSFSQNTVVLSSLLPDEERRLRAFKKEAFYFTGEDFPNFNRWQEFFNLFFLYHIISGDDGSTVAARRTLDPAVIGLYIPSLLNRYKGYDWLSETPLRLIEDTPGDLAWFDRREMILSLFHTEDGKTWLVQSKASFVIPLRYRGFFKKVREISGKTPAYQKPSYLLFLVAILLLKKDRFSSAKLYDSLRLEELDAMHRHYHSFADLIV